jgi:hypothetical protein
VACSLPGTFIVTYAIMSATTSNSPLRKQASAAIETVATEIQNAARQELDSLRHSVNVRLAALERTLARDETDAAFEPVIERLCEVAKEQAEAASTWTRAQAEAAAAKQLAAVRAQAQADLDAATSLMEETRVDFEQRLAQANAATTETARALAELRAQTDAALREGEQRFTQSEAARLKAVQALAETERVAAAARQEADAGAVSLADARTQIASLEGVRTDLMLARDIAEAHLEGELHHRNVITAEMEAARAKALHAKADADACRLELQRAAVRIATLEEQRRRRDGDAADTAPSEAAAIVGRLRSALQRLSGAATGRAMLDAALESLADSFSRTALCVVAPQGCTVWGSRGFDPPLEGRKAVIPLADDSPLRRGLDEWKPATARDEGGEGLRGLSGSPIAYAIALPIVPQDKGAIMLYAENTPESLAGDPCVAEAITGVIVDHLGQRLRPRRTGGAAEAPPYLRVRQARRVKIQDGTDVAVDGAHSTLVDLSLHGAQLLSQCAIRPNCSVRLQLPSNTGALSCEARVVWVLVEQGQDPQNALYRAGVQFTDAAPELEAFFAQHGLVEPSIRH